MTTVAMPQAAEDAARPAAEPCRPPWRVHWLLALPATIPALLFPARMGPHLAASSWLSAYIAHMGAAVLAVGSIYAQIFGAQSPGDMLPLGTLAWQDELVRPWTGFVTLAYSTLHTWPDVTFACLVVVAIEAAFWLLGLLLVPIFAAGEPRAALYFRCVKLVLWSSAGVLPLAWLAPRVFIWMYSRGPDSVALAAMLLWAAWCLTVLLRLGSRYGGPRVGPRWSQRPFRCESCGYDLSNLPLDGRCPECGETVAGSLPQHRSLPAFARSQGLVGGARGYARTLWDAQRASRAGFRFGTGSPRRGASPGSRASSPALRSRSEPSSRSILGFANGWSLRIGARCAAIFSAWAARWAWPSCSRSCCRSYWIGSSRIHVAEPGRGSR